jgi:hypothetical protein
MEERIEQARMREEDALRALAFGEVERAGLLAQNDKLRVCLLEAGPDYGRHDSGAWPSELLNAGGIPVDSHTWGYVGMVHRSHRADDL